MQWLAVAVLQELLQLLAGGRAARNGALHGHQLPPNSGRKLAGESPGPGLRLRHQARGGRYGRAARAAAQKVGQLPAVVDLHKLRVDLEVGTPGVALANGKERVDHPRHKAALLRAPAQHREALAAACWPGRHEQHVVAVDGGLHQAPELAEDLGLDALRAEDGAETHRPRVATAVHSERVAVHAGNARRHGRLMLRSAVRPDAASNAEAAVGLQDGVVQAPALPLYVGQHHAAEAMVARNACDLRLLLQQLRDSCEQPLPRDADLVAAAEGKGELVHVARGSGLAQGLQGLLLALEALEDLLRTLQVIAQGTRFPGLLHGDAEHLRLRRLLEERGPQGRGRPGLLHTLRWRPRADGQRPEQPGRGRRRLRRLEGLRGLLQRLQSPPRLHQADIAVPALALALLDGGLE
mmetsp:Transcript_80980/g.262322  ORF Transcript_80980/g.262322 Transcript_80980/m.262322 type:complete len:409 (+) Transcript_80980:842-2068(+)